MSEQVCGDGVVEKNDKLKDDVLKILEAIDTESVSYSLDEVDHEPDRTTARPSVVPCGTHIYPDSASIINNQTPSKSAPSKSEPSTSAPPSSLVPHPLLNFAGRFVTSMGSAHPYVVKQRFVNPKPEVKKKKQTKVCEPCCRRTIEAIVRNLSGRDDLTKLLLLIVPTQQNEDNHKMHCFALDSQKHLCVASVTSDERNWIEEHHCNDNYKLIFITRSVDLEDLVKNTPIKSQLFSVLTEMPPITRQAWYQGTALSIYFMRPQPSTSSAVEKDCATTNRFGIKSLNLPKIPVRRRVVSPINKNDRLALIQKFRTSEETPTSSAYLGRHTLERIRLRRARRSDVTSDMETRTSERTQARRMRTTSTHRRLEEQALQLRLEKDQANKTKEIIKRRKTILNEKVLSIRRKMDVRTDDQPSCSPASSKKDQPTEKDTQQPTKTRKVKKVRSEMTLTKPPRIPISFRQPATLASNKPSTQTDSKLAKEISTKSTRARSCPGSPAPGNSRARSTSKYAAARTAELPGSSNGRMTAQKKSIKQAEVRFLSDSSRNTRSTSKQTAVRYSSDSPGPSNGRIADKNGRTTRSISKQAAARYSSNSPGPSNNRAADKNNQVKRFQTTQQAHEARHTRTTSNQSRPVQEKQVKAEEEQRKSSCKPESVSAKALKEKSLKEEQVELEQKRARAIKMAVTVKGICETLNNRTKLTKARQEQEEKEREDAKQDYERLRMKLSSRWQKSSRIDSKRSNASEAGEPCEPPRKSTIVQRARRTQSASHEKTNRDMTPRQDRRSVSTVRHEPPKCEDQCHHHDPGKKKNICFADILLDRPRTQTKGIQMTSDKKPGNTVVDVEEIVADETAMPPIDNNGVRVLWEPHNLRESHGRIPNYNFAVQLLTPNIRTFANTGSVVSVIHKSSESFHQLLQPLDAPDNFSQRAKVKLQQKLQNLDLKTAFFKFGNLIESINEQPEPLERHLQIFFQFVEVFEFKLYARREVSFPGCEPTQYPRCRVECYVFEDRRDFVGSVAMLATQLGRYTRASRYLSVNMHFVDDAFDLTIMPSGLTRCLKCICSTFHADRVYELLAELTFGCLQPPAALLNVAKRRNEEKRNNKVKGQNERQLVPMEPNRRLSLVVRPKQEQRPTEVVAQRAIQCSEQTPAPASTPMDNRRQSSPMRPFRPTTQDEGNSEQMPKCDSKFVLFPRMPF